MWKMEILVCLLIMTRHKTEKRINEEVLLLADYLRKEISERVPKIANTS